MTSSPGGFARATAALRHGNYRAYVIGNAISLIGTWLQRVAVGWLAWELTRSGTWLGLVAFADLFPTVLFSPVTGAVADRYDRRLVLLATQVAAIAQALLLAGLTYSGAITIERLFLLTAGLGIVNAFGQPARLALIPSLVERSDLASAVAINSIVFNAARFIGPAAAGFAIAQGGTALAFALNAGSYLAFIVALLVVKPASEAGGASGRGRHFFADMAAGYAYAARHPGIGPMLVVLIITSLGTRAFVELLPGFADAVFHRGAPGLAWLTAATGLGAVVGGAWIAQRPSLSGLTSLIVANMLIMAAALLAFVATDRFWFALGCLFAAGASLVVNGVGAQTLVQTAASPEMRGRVMAIYGTIFRGGPALGALIMGAASSYVGLQWALAAGALFCALGWIWARLKQRQMAAALETPHGPRPIV